MSDSRPYALLLLGVGAVGLLALLSGRLSTRSRVPAPALFLAGATAALALSGRGGPPGRLIERLVTVALLCILFDGGMKIGWQRFRSSARQVLLLGVVGTVLTTAGLTVAAHLVLHSSWYLALLIATALAPTDPAVVFSVLGPREVSGRSGTLLEGESGANDPVGIALMLSLLSAGSLTGRAVLNVAGDFVLQMTVGVLVGLVGGRLLVLFMRRVALPSEGLYPLRTLVFAVALYAVATLLHGSGFLAVFLAGIVVGDARAPFKRDIERFHAALASLAEIVAFLALGLTVPVAQLTRPEVWVPALVLFLTLTVVIRPIAAGACLLGSGLSWGERGFVLSAGLKGAVPILLGFLLTEAHLPGVTRIYAIVIVVVMLSVVLQGGALPDLARLFRVAIEGSPQQPFAVGMRLSEEPSGALQLMVKPGSAAAGMAVDSLCNTAGVEYTWVNLVVRNRTLVQVRGRTHFAVGDEVLLTADVGDHARLAALFAPAADQL